MALDEAHDSALPDQPCTRCGGAGASHRVVVVRGVDPDAVAPGPRPPDPRLCDVCDRELKAVLGRMNPAEMTAFLESLGVRRGLD